MSAGYSGTPLVRKLGIREGSRVGVLGAPKEFAALLKGLPLGATVSAGLRGSGRYDVLVLFARRSRELGDLIAKAKGRMEESGGAWIAWPKKSSGVATDITEDVIRRAALDAGLVDNKVCAIDEIWSGLRLVVRLRDRTGH